MNTSCAPKPVRRPSGRFGASGARRRRAALAALVLVGVVSSASALQEGETVAGVRYASGGVSEAEQLAMQVRRPGFNLWVVTAVAKSGAYLSDARVRVRGPRDEVVFDAPLDGPWLMLDLPVGHYVVEASYAGETRRQGTTIHDGDHHQAVFYFTLNDASGAAR